MKLLIYSDLHLEFGAKFSIPEDTDADIVVLAGDITTAKHPELLVDLAGNCTKPILYVLGNHEYYTNRAMYKAQRKLEECIQDHNLNIDILSNEAISVGGISFFGGTMWTDFNRANPVDMQTAKAGMNDYNLIRTDEYSKLKPKDTLKFHADFKDKLLVWLNNPIKEPRVVVTHHAPVYKKDSEYKTSALQAAFNSLDMVEIIEKYQPNLWVYGHTHECDDQVIGNTRIISNQRGYPKDNGSFECVKFDPNGIVVDI